MALFGVVIPPGERPAWTAATDIRPDFTHSFENWSRQRTLPGHFQSLVKQGIRRLYLTWEPWEPQTSAEQGAPQPEWSSASIAAGKHDDYLRAWAACIRGSGMDEVVIRWGHEMNAPAATPWYPWAREPDAYVAAWRRIVDKIRGNGATNARFVWAPNPNLWQDGPTWLEGALPFWPGAGKVDYVGVTVVNYGGARAYPAGAFMDRLNLAAHVFGKPLVIPELNASIDERDRFFRDIGNWQRRTGLLHSVCLSQAASRAQAAGQATGLDWSVTTDLVGRNAVGNLVDGLREPVTESRTF